MGGDTSAAELDRLLGDAIAWPFGAVHLDMDPTATSTQRELSRADRAAAEPGRRLDDYLPASVNLIGDVVDLTAALLSGVQGGQPQAPRMRRRARAAIREAEMTTKIGNTMPSGDGLAPAATVAALPSNRFAPAASDPDTCAPAGEGIGPVALVDALITCADRLGYDNQRRTPDRAPQAEGAPAEKADHPRRLTITVDAGAHFLAIMPLWPASEPRRVLISNGLATMGFAVPAAIGAALARPGEAVWALTGDGGLSMCLGELETMARLELPITVIVFNDAALSLIEIKQQPDHGGPDAVRYRRMDFAAIARGCGLQAHTAGTHDELLTALRRPTIRRQVP